MNAQGQCSQPSQKRRPQVIDLEQALYVIQRRNNFTGEWQTEGLAIRGRTEAYKILNETKRARPNSEFRTIQKTGADDYRQGWRDCVEFALDNLEGFMKYLKEYDRKYPVTQNTIASVPA